jgi:hypothetical protein
MAGSALSLSTLAVKVLWDNAMDTSLDLRRRPERQDRNDSEFHALRQWGVEEFALSSRAAGTILPPICAVSSST